MGETLKSSTFSAGANDKLKWLVCFLLITICNSFYSLPQTILDQILASLVSLSLKVDIQFCSS